jgi:hypothetical protein
MAEDPRPAAPISAEATVTTRQLVSMIAPSLTTQVSQNAEIRMPFGPMACCH